MEASWQEQRLWGVGSAIDALDAANQPLAAAHDVGAAAPVGQYEPIGHASHAVCPLEDWNSPATHAVQLLAPAALISPGLHARGALERSMQ